MKNKLFVHTHHIASHFTNALVPVGAFLLTLYFQNGDKDFESASFYCFIFAALGGPFALASGMADWMTRFQARSTRIFNHKRIFGAFFVILSFLLVIWRAKSGAVATLDSTFRYVYLALVYIDCGFVMYLGHLGGKFI